MNLKEKWVWFCILGDFIGIISAFLLWQMHYLKSMAFGALALANLIALGEYSEPYRRARLSHLVNTITQAIIIFFFVVVIGKMLKFREFKEIVIGRGLSLLIYIFVCLAFSRLILDTFLAFLIRKGKIYFRGVVIGSTSKSYDLVNFLKTGGRHFGVKIIGFVPLPGNHPEILAQLSLPQFTLQEFKEKIAKEIEEVFLDYDRANKDILLNLIPILDGLNIKKYLIGEEYDILLGKAKLETPSGFPLIEISYGKIPPWYSTMKRIIDIIVSLIAIPLTLPLWFIIAVAIKATSPGPIFYKQIRLGKWGKPIKIYKFRTMIKDAEKDNIPQLSSLNDPRITKIGKILRKLHLDELPQFINVLKGDMTLVGPRPERPYFVKQILEVYPHYARVHIVKPGLTSLGQIRFGYASTINEIIQRSHYDILYINSMGPLMDIKILFLTVKKITKDFFSFIKQLF